MYLFPWAIVQILTPTSHLMNLKDIAPISRTEESISKADADSAEDGDVDPSGLKLPPHLKSIQVGIWRVILEREDHTKDRETAKDDSRCSTETAGLLETDSERLSQPNLWTDPLAHLTELLDRTWKKVDETHLPRLIRDVYALGPGLFWVMILSYALTGVEDALLLWLSNNVLGLVRLSRRWLSRGL